MLVGFDFVKCPEHPVVFLLISDWVSICSIIQLLWLHWPFETALALLGMSVLAGGDHNVTLALLVLLQTLQPIWERAWQVSAGIGGCSVIATSGAHEPLVYLLVSLEHYIFVLLNAHYSSLLDYEVDLSYYWLAPLSLLSLVLASVWRLGFLLVHMTLSNSCRLLLLSVGISRCHRWLHSLILLLHFVLNHLLLRKGQRPGSPLEGELKNWSTLLSARISCIVFLLLSTHISGRGFSWLRSDLRNVFDVIERWKPWLVEVRRWGVVPDVRNLWKWELLGNNLSGLSDSAGSNNKLAVLYPRRTAFR